MNTPVSYTNTTKGDTLHAFCTEASTLSIPPGPWPYAIRTEPTFGNGQPLVFTAGDDNVATYRQSLGCITVQVFND